MNDSDRYLTVEEVAGICRTTEPTVTAWARRGDITASKVGRRWLFEPRHVQAFVGQRSNRPATASAGTRQRPRRQRVK